MRLFTDNLAVKTHEHSATLRNILAFTQLKMFKSHVDYLPLKLRAKLEIQDSKWKGVLQCSIFYVFSIFRYKSIVCSHLFYDSKQLRALLCLNFAWLRDEFQRNWESSLVIPAFAAVYWWKTWQISTRIARNPTWIRTRYLLTKRIEHYFYTSLSGKTVLLISNHTNNANLLKIELFRWSPYDIMICITLSLNLLFFALLYSTLFYLTSLHFTSLHSTTQYLKEC